MKTNFAPLLLCLPLTLSGCASIVSQSQYPVTISSTPPGATVVVRDSKSREIHKAQTPTTLTLPASAGYFSKARYTLEFSKEGHAAAQVPLQAMIDPWYLGNIIFGGLIGMVFIDPLTGAMWELEDSASATLSPLAASAASPAPSAEPPTSGPDAPGRSSVVDQLRTLKQLKDEGIISAEEYEIKRAPLLESL